MRGRERGPMVDLRGLTPDADAAAAGLWFAVRSRPRGAARAWRRPARPFRVWPFALQLAGFTPVVTQSTMSRKFCTMTAVGTTAAE